MRIYTVFLHSAAGADEAVFVRQGFNWGAFLFTPFWALRRGYWLALALWLAWILAVALLTSYANLGAGAAVSLYAFGAFAFGLEADRFREAQAARNGFLLNGLTLGDSLDEAESLYFGRHLPIPQPYASSSGAPLPQLLKSGGDRTATDLLGLFPPQETQR